jgi:hypothetical protein
MSNGESTPASEARPAAAAAGTERKASFRDRLFRAVILVVVLGCVAVIYWSFAHVMAPRLKESRELSSQVFRLSTEVDDLERQWTRASAGQLSNQFSQVDQKLFEGRATFEAWLGNLREQAAPLALDVRASLGQPSLQTAGDRTLTVIPATVSVEVQPARPETTPQSPYERILLLGKRLTGERKRADLRELTVEGGTNSVTRAVMVLNYWTGKDGTL